MTNPLIDAATRLAILLEQENAALRLHDFTMPAALAEPKRDAIASCAAALAGQTEHLNPKTNSGAGTKCHDALRARLDAALAENKRLLETSVKVQAEVIAIVLRSLDRPISPQYSVNGTQSLGSAAPVALAMRA